MGEASAWAGVRRHLAARPWTVKVYVASVLVSPALALGPDLSVEAVSPILLHLLLLLGVWAGSRFAWALTLALLSVSFLLGVFSTVGGMALAFVGMVAVWIGLLVAAPTQRWVSGDTDRPASGPGFQIGRRLGRFVRSGWRTRPLTLRIYVALSLASIVVSIAVDPDQVAFPWIIFTILSLVLLKLLWSGSAGVWWLSVLTYGTAAAAALTAAPEKPSAWIQFTLSAAILMLLVHPSTRAWFNRRIAERFP